MYKKNVKTKRIPSKILLIFHFLSLKPIFSRLKQGKFPLGINFLTTVIKLFHICAKAFRQLWKSFLTAVKNMKSNEGLTKNRVLSDKKRKEARL